MKPRDAWGLRRYTAWCGGVALPVDSDRLAAFAAHLRATVKPETECEILWGLLNALRAQDPAADRVWMERQLRERWMASPARRLSNGPGRGSANAARRRFLRVEEWPPAFQEAWRAARATHGGGGAADDGAFSLLAEMEQGEVVRSPAADWAERTAEARIRIMGSFLWQRAAKGESPEISRAAVEGFLADMEGRGLAPKSVATFAVGLLRMCEVMWPDRNWAWFQDRAYGHREWAEMQGGVRLHEAQYIPIKDLRAYAHRVMGQASSMPRGRRAAAAFQRGLVLLFLSHHPVRRWNLVNMVTHAPGRMEEPEWWMGRLILDEDGFVCSWPKTKVKGVSRVERLATPLVGPMRQWLEVWRPCLVNEQSGRALWLSNAPGQIGLPLSEGGMSEVVGSATEQGFGKRIGTHAFRHIAATTIVEFAPDQADLIPKVLNHSSGRSARHYLQAAKSTMAARIYEAVVRQVARVGTPDVRFAHHRRRFRLGRASGR